MASPSPDPGTSRRGRLMPGDLMSLEQYARTRADFRARVIAHKRLRTVAVGPHTTWCFEDRLTVQYQIQEMLRAERIFEPRGIQDELDAYNPLIPDGSNLKATLLIEYTDPDERAVALTQLKGVERRCYLAVGAARVYAIADEDLERENDSKTSAVHFLRFQLGAELRAQLIGGSALAFGVDHAAYSQQAAVGADVAAALLADLTPH